MRTFGLYVGGAVDPAFNAAVRFPKIKSMGFDSISLFLTTFFYGGLWPWVIVNGKVTAKINPAYREHLRSLLLASAASGLRLHLCFVDQFHDEGGFDAIRELFGSTDEERWYSSVVQEPNNDWVKYWLDWDEAVEGKPTNFRPIGRAGQCMTLFINMVINLIATVKKNHPELPTPTWKWGNECMSEKRADGVVVPKRGDRDEVYTYVKQKWIAKGFSSEDSYFDYICVNDGKTKQDPDYIAYDVMRGDDGNSGLASIRKRHKAKLEVHGMLTVNDCNRFDFGTNRKYVKFSTDGDFKMVAEFEDLMDSNLEDVDLKFDYTKSDKRPNNVNEMLDWYLPRFEKCVKEGKPWN